MEWSKEKVLHLVDLYRERPVLWNSKSPFYKDRSRRHDALLEIAAALGESKEEVDRKVKNLCCHLSRELKKENDSARSGGDIIYKSKWFAYKSLAFLRDKNKPMKKNTAEFELQVAKDMESLKDEKEESNAGTNEATINMDYGKTEKANTFLTPKIQNVTAKKAKLAHPSIQETYSPIKNIYPQTEVRDEFTLFGEHVGIRLRKLPTHHARVLVQQIINTTLFEAELGKYNTPQQSQVYFDFPSHASIFMQPHPSHHAPTFSQSQPQFTHQTFPSSFNFSNLQSRIHTRHNNSINHLSLSPGSTSSSQSLMLSSPPAETSLQEAPLTGKSISPTEKSTDEDDLNDFLNS